MTNWNLAGDALHKRTVLVQMLIDFCNAESVRPTQVYLLKRLLFVHFKPAGDDLVALIEGLGQDNAFLHSAEGRAAASAPTAHVDVADVFGCHAALPGSQLGGR
jgi:hypothetical protein